MHRDADQIPNLFGSYVFNEEAMSQYVDEAAMNAWRACLRDGRPLTLDVAGAIADGMKVWALEHGATHFTHWFQPRSTTASSRPSAAERSAWSFPARSW